MTSADAGYAFRTFPGNICLDQNGVNTYRITSTSFKNIECLECGQRNMNDACFVVIFVAHTQSINLETANASVAAGLGALGALVAMGFAVCDHGTRLYQ